MGELPPLVIQAAFAHGRPVICSDVGGMAEKVRDGADGLHFRVGDPASLTDTMARAMETPGLWDWLRAGVRPPHRMADHLAVLADLYRRAAAARR